MSSPVSTTPNDTANAAPAAAQAPTAASTPTGSAAGAPLADASSPRADKTPLMAAAAAGLVAVFALGYAYVHGEQLHRELGRRAVDAEVSARDARKSVDAVKESLAPLTQRMTALEAKQTETQSQQVSLQQMYQELARSRDEWVLTEVEQTVSMAAQQLQLAGNVKAALLALSAADARIARGDRPQFMPLRRALAKDIEALKALPDQDVAGVIVAIDNVLQHVDQLPILTDPGPRDREGRNRPPSSAPASWWESLLDSLKSEMGGWLRVRRIDQPDAMLIAPDQAYFARENLRLRLLSARLAVLSRNDRSFRSDLAASKAWVERYFDRDAKVTQAMLLSLQQLDSQSLMVELPSLADTLTAIRTMKMAGEPQ